MKIHSSRIKKIKIGQKLKLINQNVVIELNSKKIREIGSRLNKSLYLNL